MKDIFKFKYICQYCRREYESDYPNDNGVCHNCSVKLYEIYKPKDLNTYDIK